MGNYKDPVQMLYCLEGGQITVNYKSGKKEVYNIKAGDAMQAPGRSALHHQKHGRYKILFPGNRTRGS